MSDSRPAEYAQRTIAPLISREGVAAGQFVYRRDRALYPIPGTLNLCLAVVQMSAALWVLTLISRGHGLYRLALLPVSFAFVMQLPVIQKQRSEAVLNGWCAALVAGRLFGCRALS